ncbi:MAG: hypothetical protein JWM33_2668 [Caulobacteraceae bacterium]|nr:hypothetical protein [Caulobacteraceae bacterium]
MANIEKVSIALTADMAGMVRQAVDSGEYATASEVVRDALRDWKAKREFSRRQIDELRRLVDEGLASGSKPWSGAEAILTEARRRAKTEA